MRSEFNKLEEFTILEVFVLLTIMESAHQVSLRELQKGNRYEDNTQVEVSALEKLRNVLQNHLNISNSTDILEGILQKLKNIRAKNYVHRDTVVLREIRPSR